MPVYFFHTQDRQITLDNVGTALPDLDTAKIEAVRLLGALILDQAEQFLSAGMVKLMVTNAQGVLMFALELSAVEPPKIKPRLVKEFL